MTTQEHSMTQRPEDPVYPPPSELELITSDFELYKSLKESVKNPAPMDVFGRKWFVTDLSSVVNRHLLTAHFRIRLIEVMEVKK